MEFGMNENLRTHYDFNPGWRFFLGDCPGAEQRDWDDEDWTDVDLPHGLEMLPENSSGGRNYQGMAWYRKRFTPPPIPNTRVVLRFEGVMGHSLFYVNGKLLQEHWGGYLPIHLDVTDSLLDGENVLAVACDNSNSPDYPPGKPQELLDFCYFGGIYRNVSWIQTSSVFFSDGNDDRWENPGYFFRCLQVNENKAHCACHVHGVNLGTQDWKGRVELTLWNPNNEKVHSSQQVFCLEQDGDGSLNFEWEWENPELWTPETPALHCLELTLMNSEGISDSISVPVGIRTFVLDGENGLILNGKSYQKKLFGANRHQDYPHIGNALGSFLHERDAIKLRNAGLNIIRAAHYPQDPSFLDACDRLGLLVIEATPGWQFFNKKGPFVERVLKDIQQMIRRDRNRASVVIWEPILNETEYPRSFAKKALETARNEDPDRPCAADRGTPGSSAYPLVYAHSLKARDSRPVFTREWGDAPDDWYNQNGRHRHSYAQGERAQMTQVERFLSPESAVHEFLTMPEITSRSSQYLGAALWAGMDCQRGYHPDPFYGGVLDMHRREKYSYHFFSCQQAVSDGHAPQIFIANEYAPSSPEDVMVFCNCEQVSLELNGKEIGRQKIERQSGGYTHPVVFPNAFEWTRFDKPVSTIRARGWVGKKAVVSIEQPRPGRAELLRIIGDFASLTPCAGGDILPFFVEITDVRGVRVPHAEDWIHLTLEGDGEILGNEEKVFMNPVRAAFGSAPFLVKTGRNSGILTLTATSHFPGTFAPSAATLSVEVSSCRAPALYSQNFRREVNRQRNSFPKRMEGDSEQWKHSLEDVGLQQEAFIRPEQHQSADGVRLK